MSLRRPIALLWVHAWFVSDYRRSRGEKWSQREILRQQDVTHQRSFSIVLVANKQQAAARRRSLARSPCRHLQPIGNVFRSDIWSVTCNDVNPLCVSARHISGMHRKRISSQQRLRDARNGLFYFRSISVLDKKRFLFTSETQACVLERTSRETEDSKGGSHWYMRRSLIDASWGALVRSKIRSNGSKRREWHCRA